MQTAIPSFHSTTVVPKFREHLVLHDALHHEADDESAGAVDLFEGIVATH